MDHLKYVIGLPAKDELIRWNDVVIKDLLVDYLAVTNYVTFFPLLYFFLYQIMISIIINILLIMFSFLFFFFSSLVFC